MKKNILFTALAGVLLFISVSAMAQPHHHRGHGPAGRGQPQQITSYNGSVSEWSYNDDFVYDGLYLKTGESTLLVKFPPHLGQQIRSLGNSITVNGVLRYTPEGRQELKMVSISGKGRTIYDQKPVPHTTLPKEVFVNGSGKVSQIQINKKGDACGYILDNGVALRIPPHAILQLSEMVQVGSAIDYTGVEKELKDGQVQAQKYKIVRCQTISVNGAQYMVK